MVNYYIYAKDFSGSTEGVSYYHHNALDTVEHFKSDVENIEKELSIPGEPPAESKIIYLHWGDKCYEVDENKTITSYLKLKSGNMGTDPETIVQWIKCKYGVCGKTNKIQLLYIITDGLIESDSVKRCFQINRNMSYEKVVYHAFNEDLSQIDLSVAASFFKSRCKVYRNSELFDDIDISEAYNYDKVNVGNFGIEKENLKSYIKLKYIKSKYDVLALQEIDQLKKMRNRLFQELSSKSQKVLVNLNTKDKNAFLREFDNTEWYKNLTNPDYNVKIQIDKTISTLINYIVSDTKSYSFDALNFDMKYHNVVEEEPIVDVNFTAEQEIEFPDIILDDDKGIPVIILTEFNLLDKLIFHKRKESEEVSLASFSKFKSMMECPLFLVNDPDISESIGYFYTLNVYKQLLTQTSKTEPRTRRPFHGGLVLTDSDQFDKYNDYILSATYFGFKKVKYNIGLFYFVLWKNCENKEWMDRNVVKQFKKYVMRRINETVCRIGLSSLPLDPQEYTSLLSALWYCVELSSCIFKDDRQNFAHERLRMYYGVADYMIEILKHFDYNLDLEFIRKRRHFIKHVMDLKRIQKWEDKVYYLLKEIFKTENGFLVSEIEKPSNLKNLNYLKINHSGMFCDDVLKETVHLNDYVYMMHSVDDLTKLKTAKRTFEICEKTFRPYFTIDQNKSFYTELLRDTKKVVINNDDDMDNINITYETVDSLEFDKIISLFNLFINYVKDYKTYPTFSEYVEYISRKKKFNGELVTIFPPSVYTDAENVYSLYQNVATKVKVEQFLKASISYVTRSERIKAEEILKFDNEMEITAFISNEEKKVLLKKKDIKLVVPFRFPGRKKEIFVLPVSSCRKSGKGSKLRFIFKSL